MTVRQTEASTIGPGDRDRQQDGGQGGRTAPADSPAAGQETASATSNGTGSAPIANRENHPNLAATREHRWWLVVVVGGLQSSLDGLETA
jgi:hypothetical protein